ncbi:MAG: 1-acyl-sn-glycerol-3-phosphate acyltransferase [Planctomycetes bacterium]|nr:1-acyl-sn-glycerol-3-phosphate acyltransferase [Planctomycetota bacterium]
MKEMYLTLRSVVLWMIATPVFFCSIGFLIVLALIVGAPRTDKCVRFFSRVLIHALGVHYRVVYPPDFDRTRTYIFVSNHVNIFDPFVIYAATNSFSCGMELETHFKIPMYGWFMKIYGNVPVAEEKSTANVRKVFRLTKETLNRGINLMVLPEGTRTLTGKVGEFSDGIFVMAQKFKHPIVPVSLVGSFQMKRKGDWMLRPSRITVHVHEAIEMDQVRREDVPALRDRVREIVAGPVHADLFAHPADPPPSQQYALTEGPPAEVPPAEDEA